MYKNLVSLSLFSFKDAALDNDAFPLPYHFLFIGLINVGPEFQAEFVGFSAGSTGYIIAKIVAVS